MREKIINASLSVLLLSAGLVLVFNSKMTVFICLSLLLFLAVTIYNFYLLFQSAKDPGITNRQLSIDERLKDDGVFKFVPGGFLIGIGEKEESIDWHDIEIMLAYKMDCFTVDSICLDIYCNNGRSFMISEETAGWYQFVERSKKEISVIDSNWDSKIVFPPFATNLSLVFDKQQRSLEEITATK